jgi:hypothetical protein
MRLSALVVASILLVSVSLMAQHSSGGGSSSGGSHGSSGGGVSSAAPSHVSSPGTSRSSRVSVPASSAKAGSNMRIHSPEAASSARPEKRTYLALLGYRKPTLSEFRTPIGCKKGANGQCIAQLQSVSCSMNAGWRGFGCGAQTSRDDCRLMTRQLLVEQQLMQGGFSQNFLRYGLLQNQYYRCEGAYPYGLRWSPFADD